MLLLSGKAEDAEDKRSRVKHDGNDIVVVGNKRSGRQKQEVL
jgi:hypothetical protein